MHVTDLRELADLLDPRQEVPPRRVRVARYLAEIVEAATAHPRRGAWVVTAIPCRRRPGRRPCPGTIAVQCSEVPAIVRWQCPGCADEGLVRQWRDTPWDFSKIPAEPFEVEVVLTLEEHEILRTISLWDPEPERLFAAAERIDEGVLLSGSLEALEHLTGYVAAESNAEPRPRRRRLLDTVCDKLEAHL